MVARWGGIAGIFLAFLAGCAVTPSRFDIALIGDQQYSAESEAQFPHLMAALDESGVAFVVHVGDFKAGAAMPCDDVLFRSRLEQFDASRHPFIYTPGDNEWTDCHNPKAGGYRPVEALERLRGIFFQGNQSLGRRRMDLERQSGEPAYGKFRENARWSRGGVLFATIHMVGDNNNLGRTAEDDAEFRERNAANLAWLSGTFAAARRGGHKAVALFTQANPRFEYRFPRGRIRAVGAAPPPERPNGFTEFLIALEKEVVAFQRPVVLFHGDSHYFRVDKPLFRTGETSQGDRGRQIENFTRVEVYGFPDAHWLRIMVDPDSHGVFAYKEEIVERNRFGRR